jgi:hypothetical protein
MSDGDGRKRHSDGLVSATALLAVFLTAAVSFILFGYLEQVKYYRNANQNSDEYTRNTYAPEANRCLLRFSSSESQSDCIAKASNEERQYRRDEQDLAAQKTSAIWAFLMGSAALIGMVLSAYGVLLVWRTFKATREGNLIARQIGEAQTRAYVGIAHLNVVFGENDAFIKADASFVNTGQTPARNAMVSVVWCGENFPFNEDWWNEFLPESKGSIGAGQKIYMSQRTDDKPNDPNRSLSQEQIIEIKTGRMGFWFLGIIEYDDVFGKPHKSYERFFLKNTEDKMFKFIIEPSGREDT